MPQMRQLKRAGFSWSQYLKMVFNGETFAVVGKRYYSQEAVEYAILHKMPPSVVNEIIENGISYRRKRNTRQTMFKQERLSVVTEVNASIVRSILKVDWEDWNLAELMDHANYRQFFDPEGYEYLRRDGIVGSHNELEFGKN